MPILHNPSGARLFCHRLERIVDAGEFVEITDEQADALEHGSVFVVSRPAKRTAPAEDASDAPKRETVKRGSKRAEVTKAPEAETRG